MLRRSSVLSSSSEPCIWTRIASTPDCHAYNGAMGCSSLAITSDWPFRHPIQNMKQQAPGVRQQPEILVFNQHSNSWSISLMLIGSPHFPILVVSLPRKILNIQNMSLCFKWQQLQPNSQMFVACNLLPWFINARHGIPEFSGNPGSTWCPFIPLGLHAASSAMRRGLQVDSHRNTVQLLCAPSNTHSDIWPVHSVRNNCLVSCHILGGWASNPENHNIKIQYIYCNSNHQHPLTTIVKL